MKYTNRTIRVSMPYIIQAMASKEEFEALAFCLFVQLNLTSSTIKNATVRRLKEITHMGSDRLKRITNYCIEHGMIEMQGDGTTMVIKPLCKDGKVIYKFKNKYAKRNRKETLQFNLTLTKVKDMLRKAVVANHIRKVENVREQTLLTQNPTSIQEYRMGRYLVRRLSVWGLIFFTSNKRLANIANCSVSKVRNIKNSLIASGEIERKFSNDVVCDDATTFDINEYRKYYDDDCFLFLLNGKVYKHNPNIYDYKGQNIVVVPKNNK